jgi:hypothetical protein
MSNEWAKRNKNTYLGIFIQCVFSVFRRIVNREQLAMRNEQRKDALYGRLLRRRFC